MHHSEIVRPLTGSSMSWFLFLFVWRDIVRIFVLTCILLKIMLKKFQTLWKSIRDSVKNRCFLRFHNGSRNMFVNARDVNWFFIFPIMLLEQLSKHVHMYCRFQGTLMSNISFILKHHCVETVQIRSYLWSVFSCIQSEYRKIRTRNKSVFG